MFLALIWAIRIILGVVTIHFKSINKNFQSSFSHKYHWHHDMTLACVIPWNIDNKTYWKLTTATPSFNSDSPKTHIYKTTLTWISSKTDITATGSTAEIILPNRRHCRIFRPASSIPRTRKTTKIKTCPSIAELYQIVPGIHPALYTPNNDNPMANALNNVPTIAYSIILPQLSKNGSFSIKYPASSTIGGKIKRKNVSGLNKSLSIWCCGLMA